MLAIATRRWDGWLKCVDSWYEHVADLNDAPHHYVVANEDVLVAYQEAFQNTTEPILGMVHDDVIIYGEAWDERVLREFDDQSVGLVGLGGARRHGSANLYSAPYELSQLGRFGFLSNMRNAEAHGERFAGECDVAVLDGFALIVRRSILERAGGWPLSTPINYFCYDYWLCCEARRQGYRIRLVGVDCEHLSGRTASMVQLTDDHAAAHEWLYDNYSDVLPYAVEEK